MYEEMFGGLSLFFVAPRLSVSGLENRVDENSKRRGLCGLETR